MKQGSITSFMKKKINEQEAGVNEQEKLKSSSKSTSSKINAQDSLKKSKDTPEKVQSSKQNLSQKKDCQKEFIEFTQDSRKKRKHILDEDEEEVIKTETLAEELLIPSKESKLDKGKF